MKYRIKNPDIEKAVRGLFVTQEAFEKQLNAWSEYHFKYYSNYSCIKIVANSAESITGYACELYVATSDVEEVVEYDPKVWNDYSKVKPPKEGWYRVEHDCKDEVIHRAMYWDGENWLDQEMVFKRQTGWIKIEKGNPRFKPWDNEESEE